MDIKLKVKDGKETVVVTDEIQLAAFLNSKSFEPATKEDEAKIKKLKEQK